MPRALTVCTTHGCPNLVDRGKCDDCKRKAEAQRGTASQRGYGSVHRRTFRRRVLTKHPWCRCTSPGHGHGARCMQPSRHADHWPLGRDELIRRGLDPNDPAHGRGLCHPCHSSETTEHQPGGWNAR